MTRGLTSPPDIAPRARGSWVRRPSAHGYVDNASALTTSPQAQQQQEKTCVDSNNRTSIVSVTPDGPGAHGGRESLLTHPDTCPTDGVHLRIHSRNNPVWWILFGV